MKNTLYSEGMKMADLISSDPSLLIVIARLDIKLGFGDASVADICKRYRLSKNLFLMICDIYSFDGFKPSTDNLTLDDIPHIISYLKTSHKYYTSYFFPRLRDDIHLMIKACNESDRKIMNKFYDDYDAEVRKHFDYEEKTVFPYIETLLANGNTGKNYNIGKFEKNHSNIEEKLNDLKSIVTKYLPETCSSPARYDVLCDIFHIELDLSKHTLIENELLVPLVKRQERNE
ncbi:MAG: hemerythrin domain-containing protein [Bacteroidales bacterium]|jgi:regulator of cell morphogenesis and NO signaling|nr:hemerythrin domain-containing protein [Bacteroidales bacterium]